MGGVGQNPENREINQHAEGGECEAEFFLGLADFCETFAFESNGDLANKVERKSATHKSSEGEKNKGGGIGKFVSHEYIAERNDGGEK